jgi:hypothetical protein
MKTRYATMLVVAAASLLLSGLSLISSYQPAIAQVEMTGEAAGGGGAADDNATTTIGGTAEGGNATDAAVEANQSEIRLLIEEALAALQNNDTQGAMMNLDLAHSALGGNSTTTAGFVEVEDEDEEEEGGVEVEDEDEGVDDVDEPGDIDVNDEEDTDTGNEDAGEVEEEDEGGVGAGGVGAG